MTSPGTLERLWSIEFRHLVWVLPCCWAAHEAEEWNIIRWYQTYWTGVPPMRPVAVWTGLALISLAGFAWTLVGALQRTNSLTAFVVLPFFTVLAVGNAVQHVYFVFKFGAYAPGVITAVLLVVPATVGLTVCAMRRGHIPGWYAALIYLPAIPQLLLAIGAGNRMPGAIRSIHRFSERVAGFLFG